MVLRPRANGELGPFVEPVPEDGAEGAVAEHYRSARESAGHVSNYVAAFSLRPEIYAAWRELGG